VTKKLTEDVFESIFLLRKEHTLQHLEFIWADLLTEEEVVVAEGEIDTVVVIDTVVAIAIVVVVAAEEVMDVDDHLPHTTEVVVAEAAEIIVLDHDLIHPVDIERGQTGDVVEIFKKILRY